MNLPYSRSSRHGLLERNATLITISGRSGVGTSTALKETHNAFCCTWHKISGGEIMRAQAASYGVSIEEFAKLLLEHPEIDRDLDETLMKKCLAQNTLIEARLAHIHGHGFHVLITCPNEIRLMRRAQQWKDDGLYPGLNLSQLEEKARKELAERDDDDHERYKALYPGYCWPEADFDLVLQSNLIPKGKIGQTIKEGYKGWVSSCP